MRLTKLVTVGFATAALAASGATAGPGHGKSGTHGPACRPAPMLLAGTLANDPATGDTSFMLTVKHGDRLGGRVDEVLRLLEAEARDRANDFDHLDLLAAGAFEHHVE